MTAPETEDIHDREKEPLEESLYNTEGRLQTRPDTLKVNRLDAHVALMERATYDVLTALNNIPLLHKHVEHSRRAGCASE